jgi:hypothetical protein
MLPLAPLVLNEALHALEKWLPARAGLLENALLAQDAEGCTDTFSSTANCCVRTTRSSRPSIGFMRDYLN